MAAAGKMHQQRIVDARLSEEMGGVFHTEHYLKEIERMFEAADKRRAGAINFEELFDYLPTAMNLIAEECYRLGYDLRIAMPLRGEAEKIFNDHDLDGDKQLNAKEFRGVVEECARGSTRALTLALMEQGIDTFKMETASQQEEDDEEWNAMKGSMDELRNHVSELDTKADGLANRVEALEKHSKDIVSRFEEVELAFAEDQEKLFSGLQAQTDASKELEKKVESNTGDIDVIREAVSQLEDIRKEIATLETAIESQGKETGNVATSLSALEESGSSSKVTLDEHTASISELRLGMETVAEMAEDLENKVASLETRLLATAVAQEQSMAAKVEERMLALESRQTELQQSLVEVGAASKEEREEQLAAQEEQRQVERQAVQDSLQALRDQEEKIALEVATFASAVEELRAQVQSSSDEMKSQNQLQSQTQDRLQEDLDNLVEKVRKHKGQFKEGQQRNDLQLQLTAEQVQALELSLQETSSKVDGVSSRTDAFEDRVQRCEQSFENSAAGSVEEISLLREEGEKQAQATKQQLEQLENSFRATDAKVEELSSRADTFEERFQRFEQAAEESAAGHVVEFAALKEENGKQVECVSQQVQQLDETSRTTISKVDALSSRTDDVEGRVQQVEQALQQSSVEASQQFLSIQEEVQARVEAVRDSLKLETGQLFGLTLELDNKLENLMSESGQDVEAVNERVKELDEDVEFLNLELARCIEELDTKFENSKALSQEEHEVLKKAIEDAQRQIEEEKGARSLAEEAFGAKIESVSSDVSGLRADVNLQVEEQQKNLQSLHAQLEVVQQSQEALQVQAEETAKSSAEGLQKEVEQLWERNRALEEELSKLDKSVEEGLKGVESRNEERILQLQETQLKQSEDLTNFKDSFATKTEEELNKIAEELRNSVESNTTNLEEQLLILQSSVEAVKADSTNSNEELKKALEETCTNLAEQVASSKEQDASKFEDQSKELEALREQIQLLEAGSSQHLVALQEEQSQLSQKNREDLEGLQNRVDELLAGLQKVQKQAEESAAEAQAANENQVQNLEKSLLALQEDMKAAGASASATSVEQSQRLESVQEAQQQVNEQVSTLSAELEATKQSATQIETSVNTLREALEQDRARLDAVQEDIQKFLQEAAAREKQVAVELEASVQAQQEWNSAADANLKQTEKRTLENTESVEKLAQEQAALREALEGISSGVVAESQNAIRAVEDKNVVLEQQLSEVKTLLQQQQQAFAQQIQEQQASFAQQLKEQQDATAQQFKALADAQAQDRENQSKELAKEVQLLRKYVDELNSSQKKELSEVSKQLEELRSITTEVVQDVLTRMAALDDSMGKLHRDNTDTRTRVEACEEQNRTLSTSFQDLSYFGETKSVPSSASATPVRRPSIHVASGKKAAGSASRKR